MENEKICTNSNGCECARLWNGDPKQLAAMQDKCIFYHYRAQAKLFKIQEEALKRKAENISNYMKNERRFFIFRNSVCVAYWLLTLTTLTYIFVVLANMGSAQ